jgi:putative ABC transport system permease protein
MGIAGDGMGGRWMDDLRRDVTYAARSLRRSRSFTVAAILTLAVGIGATTAIYSVVHAILLRPLPFADADRLVRIDENVRSRSGDRIYQMPMSHQAFREWSARSRTLDGTIAVAGSMLLVQTSEGAARLWGRAVSADAFTLLGTTPLLGRTLLPADEGRTDVVVLGFDAWRRLFRSAPDVVGRTIAQQGANASDRRLLTIVGVLPEGFSFPSGFSDYYVPIAAVGGKVPYNVNLIGRLAPGISLDAARQEAAQLGAALLPPRPNGAPLADTPRFPVRLLKEHVVSELGRALRVLLAAAAVVLLIVCANVANLLLARGATRQREIAVRLAVGASRGRVVRQVLTECVVLSLSGGALGAGLAAAGVALVRTLATVEAPGVFRFALGESVLPRTTEISVDLTILAIAAGVAMLTSLVVGVLPALQVSRTNHLQAMGARGGSAGRGASHVRSALVVGQLGMATMLLVGAGLLAHSFLKVSSVDRGYDASHVLAFQLVFPADYTVARKTEAIETMLSRVRALPGVAAVGFTRANQMIGEIITLGTFVPPGRTLEEMRAQPVRTAMRPVSHGYLTAIGARVLEGRELEAADRSTAVPGIVISRSAARVFGQGSHVGQLVDWHMGENRVFQLRVVGVVEDLHNESPEDDPYPEVFMDYQRLLTLGQESGEATGRISEWALGLLSFSLRTHGDPAPAIPLVSRTVRAVDPNAGIDVIVPLERLVASSVARPRFYAVTFSVFAAVAVFLAAIGAYGVLAYAVVQRTQEIGIRMALGAQRAQVLALVLRRGLLLTIVGVGLGLAGAGVSTRYLQSLLFGITPLDASTFAVVTLAFSAIAGLACYLPARRATLVDPLVALRNEA